MFWAEYRRLRREFNPAVTGPGAKKAAGMKNTTWLLLALVMGSCLSVCAAKEAQPWETWQETTFDLEAGESVQFRVDFAQIPVRTWRLRVEGGDLTADLNILRLQDESLLYFETEEPVHDVTIPWGKGEEIAVAIVAGRAGGVFHVSFLGPPRQKAPAAYSYGVNRALEAYASGQRLAAQKLCEDALRADPADDVARVMLAGFLRDLHFYERAAKMIEIALAGDLPGDMKALAAQLQQELQELRAPLAAEVREGLAAADQELADGDPGAALATCDRLLADPELGGPARSLLLQYRGRALHELDRFFEAVDAYTQALTVTTSREEQAIIYFRMARLFLDMDNPTQAEGAFNIARQYGLPAGLELQAAEAVERITAGRD